MFRRRTVALLWSSSTVLLFGCGSAVEPRPVAGSADISVTSLSASPDGASAGSPVALTLSIGNTRTEAAAGSTAEVRITAADAATAQGAPVVARLSIPAIGAGDAYTTTRTFDIPAGEAAGFDRLWVVLDVDDRAGESDTSNDASSMDFLVSTTAVKYSVTDLDSLYGASANFVDLNDAGVMVGTIGSGPTVRNVMVRGGVVTDLGACSPVAVNDATVVACQGDSTWTNEQLTPLGIPGAKPQSINDAGQVAGFVVDATNPLCQTVCAFVWDRGKSVLVPAHDFSAHFARMHTTDPGSEIQMDDARGARTWFADSTSTPVSCPASAPARIVAVANGATAVGWMGGGSPADAVICKAGQLLPTSTALAAANDVSRKGVVVGQATDQRTFVMDDAGVEFLTNVLATPGWRMVIAELVNDSGQIIGTAQNTSTNAYHQVLLARVP